VTGSLTRKARLGQEFIAAADRGLTAHEARGIAGKNWRRRITELRDEGWSFREQRSRYAPHGVYRWVLVYYPDARHWETPEDTAPAMDPLFDPPVAPPARALEAA
jgi:hypothetical protein